MRSFLGILFFFVLGMATPAFSVENNSTLVNSDQHSALDYGDALVYGLVEGVTEFLPVSSTGHLILTKEWMGKANEEEVQSALNAYLIVIQAGAILAVALLYWKDVWAMGLGLLGLDPRGRALARNVLLAFLPAAAIGPFLDEVIEKKLFGALPVAIALLGGAALMFAAERMRANRERVDATGSAPKSFFSMTSSRKGPIAAAGKNANNTLRARARPRGSSPSKPKPIAQTSFQYNNATARMAPACITIKYAFKAD
jgi:hypothetical protein